MAGLLPKTMAASAQANTDSDEGSGTGSPWFVVTIVGRAWLSWVVRTMKGARISIAVGDGGTSAGVSAISADPEPAGSVRPAEPIAVPGKGDRIQPGAPSVWPDGADGCAMAGT